MGIEEIACMERERFFWEGNKLHLRGKILLGHIVYD